jgi:lipid-A-disaccharide synthase
MKKILIIAGEESGDQHASSFIKNILKQRDDISFFGIGGTHMEQAGAKILYNLAAYGVTGLFEIIKSSHIIYQVFKILKTWCQENIPDLVILVDYPGFNLRFAKYLKRHYPQVKILYYISPQIWAWKASRLKTIQKYIDTMAVILPFEKEIYTKTGIEAYFVGHPLMQNADLKLSLRNGAAEGTELNNSSRSIALLPGSRIHEIKKHLPVMLKAMSSLDENIQVLIPVAETIDIDSIRTYCKYFTLNCEIAKGSAIEMMARSEVVIVASGTASLEAALLMKPMCIVYKSNFITAFIARLVIKIPYLGLCNILQGEMIVPELLQNACNSQNLALITKKLLHDKSYRETMQKNLSNLCASLGDNQRDCSMEELILRKL